MGDNEKYAFKSSPDWARSPKDEEILDIVEKGHFKNLG